MNKAEKLALASNDRAGESLGKNRRVDRPAPAVQGPSKFAGVSSLSGAAVIEVARIVRDPNQPREEFDEEAIDRLAQSIKTRGQLQPVRVRWDEEQGVYVLIAGERRWLGIQRAGLPTVTAVIEEGELDPDALLEIQLVENCLREDLKPIEQAKAYRRVMNRRGWSTTRVATELHISQGSVVKALKLLELPEEVQVQVEQGVLAPSTAYQISKIQGPEEQVAVAAQAVAGRLRRDEVEEKAGGGKPRSSVRIKCGDRVVTISGPRDRGEILATFHEGIRQVTEWPP
jgi:ParB family transcriptional regulator, chromosome partitioning protein